MNEELEAARPALSEQLPQGALSGFGRPDDILSSRAMTREQKRAVLAFWLSDSHAVQDAPALRRLDNGAIADVDDLLQALRSLDDGDGPKSSEKELFMPPPVTRRQVKLLTKRHRPTTWRFSQDEDDDPPPRPALAARSMRLRFVQATGDRTPQAA